MATELELLYERTLKTLLEQQEIERVKLSKELESLRAENLKNQGIGHTMGKVGNRLLPYSLPSR